MINLNEQLENACANFMENNYKKFLVGFRTEKELKKNIINFYVQKEDYEKCSKILQRKKILTFN